MAQNYEGTSWDLQGLRSEDGTLISFAWPGGYPTYYIDAENNVLCSDCANDSELPENEWFDEHKPVVGDVYYEGPTMHCDQCNKEIESAYGDPDQEEEEEK